MKQPKNKYKRWDIIIWLIFLIIFVMICILFGTTKDDSEWVNVKKCTFTRTYKVLAIYDSNDDDYKWITIRSYQDEDIATVKIKNKYNINKNENYEIKFKVEGKIKKDNISDIYNNSSIISIDETDKEGLEQLNEKICS